MITELRCEQKISFISNEDITDGEKALIRQHMGRYVDEKIEIMCSKHILKGKNGYIKLICKPNNNSWIIRHLTPLENLIFKLRWNKQS